VYFAVFDAVIFFLKHVMKVGIITMNNNCESPTIVLDDPHGSVSRKRIRLEVKTCNHCKKAHAICFSTGDSPCKRCLDMGIAESCSDPLKRLQTQAGSRPMTKMKSPTKITSSVLSSSPNTSCTEESSCNDSSLDTSPTSNDWESKWNDITQPDSVPLTTTMVNGVAITYLDPYTNNHKESKYAYSVWKQGPQPGVYILAKYNQKFSEIVGWPKFVLESYFTLDQLSPCNNGYIQGQQKMQVATSKGISERTVLMSGSSDSFSMLFLS